MSFPEFKPSEFLAWAEHHFSLSIPAKEAEQIRTLEELAFCISEQLRYDQGPQAPSPRTVIQELSKHLVTFYRIPTEALRPETRIQGDLART